MNDHKHLTAAEWGRLHAFWLEMENQAFWNSDSLQSKYARNSFYRVCQANTNFCRQMWRQMILRMEAK